MKFIITESKLQKAALLWMNKNFSPDQLEVVESPRYPNSTFYIKNGKIIMEQDKKYKLFYFHYDEIWSFFKSFFSMEREEIQELLKIWLEETFNLRGYTPDILFNADMKRVERDIQFEGVYAYCPIEKYL